MPAPDPPSAAARVLLVNLNRYDQPYPVYPLGLAYLDGALRAAGHSTRWWDSLQAAGTLEDCAAEFRPTVVGVAVRNIDNVQAHNPRSFIHEVVAVCRQLRKISVAPVVLGGSGFSIFPRELFELTGADYGVAGEGEQPLLRLVAELAAGRTPHRIPGVWSRDGATSAIVTPCHAAAAEFTGHPHHDPALLQAYLARGALIGVQTQRGCPLRCCYCTYPIIEGRRSRFRRGEETVGEMRRLAALGVRYAFIVDSVFNTDPDHVAETCEALIRAEVGMEWECFLRPHGVTRELLHLMQRAGLRHIEFGSDSLSDEVLQRYGKSFRFDDVRTASEFAHGLGLRYSHFIIFGGPGETSDTVEETLARARTLPGAYFFATIGMRIYPDTPMWQTLKQREPGVSAAEYLVEPRFHLEPPFTVQSLTARLREVQRTASNWAVGDPPPIFIETITRLRQRGIHGPMWEYAELLQRFQSASG